MIRPRVHLIHGILTWNPHNGIGLLKNCFEEVGFKESVVEDYGFLPVGLAWLLNKSIARNLLPYIEPGSIIVAHSNGAAITYYMLEMGLKLSGLILLNPALDRDKAMPSGVFWVHVYHNPGDMMVRLAKWIPNHIWGDQGRWGYSGNDHRYRNFNTANFSTPLEGHSDWWTDKKIQVSCPILAKDAWDKYLQHGHNA